MIKKSTSSDLVLYAYNEAGLADSDRIQKSIDGDPLVNAEFQEIFNAMKQFENTAPVVPARCIEKILQFC